MRNRKSWKVEKSKAKLEVPKKGKTNIGPNLDRYHKAIKAIKAGKSLKQNLKKLKDKILKDLEVGYKSYQAVEANKNNKLAMKLLASELLDVQLAYDEFESNKSIYNRLPDSLKVKYRSFKIVFGNPVLLKAAMEFAKEEFSLENFQYMIERNNLSKDYLFDTYIKPNAKHQLNLDSRTCFSVKHPTSKDDVKWKSVYKVVKENIEDTIFRFAETDLWKEEIVSIAFR